MLDTRRIALAVIAALLTGCELSQIPQSTPTAEIESLLTPSPTVEITATPSVTLTIPPQLEQTNTPTLGTPLPTGTDTPTPDPYATYIIQPNDTMLYIIQQAPFYYRNTDVIAEILRLNPQIPDRDHLPGPGSSILIPLPTGTATPEGFALTASAQPNVPQIGLPSNAEIIQVTVQEGETIIGIAQKNATTLSIMATLNPQLGFYNCDFANPSGGPDCNVPLAVGEAVNAPALTPTPTLSPTISGSETATLTPTYSAPMLVYPPQDAIAPARTFQLQWISVGVLKDQEVYLVEIQDQTAGTQHIGIAHSTSYQLPDDLIPSDGQTHAIQWRVSVAAPNSEGKYAYIGARGDWRRFSWQSR